jgi:hypothetical protein
MEQTLGGRRGNGLRDADSVLVSGQRRRREQWFLRIALGGMELIVHTRTRPATDRTMRVDIPSGVATIIN